MSIKLTTLPGSHQTIVRHYHAVWKSEPAILRLQTGPMIIRFPDFCVLEYPPFGKRTAWTYATCGMSALRESKRLELYLLSPSKTSNHVELLTAIAHYHGTGTALHAGDSVNFGRGWFEGSPCAFGLISLPYLDGPTLQCLKKEPDGVEIQCLWLLPISEAEREFKKMRGVDALEARFEAAQFNYLDPHRPRVI